MSNLLGELAQDEFKRWCSKHNMIASAPTPDRMGWDFLVEWEPNDQSGPLDSQNTLPKAFVQVKATNSRKRSTAISAKLSALKKLVDTELPAFIVHLRFQNQEVVEALLLRIGPQEIEKILSRVRKAEAKGEQINHVRLSLPLASAVAIATNGRNLRSLLEEGLKKPYAPGTPNKRDYVQSVGYGEGEGGLHVQFIGEPATLVDHWVGLTPSWHFSSAKYEEKRFGIALETDTRLVENGQVSIVPIPIAQVTATIVTKDRDVLSRTVLDVVGPPRQIADPTTTKYLFRNDFVSLLFDFGTEPLAPHLTFAPNPSTTYKWGKLIEILGFAVHLANPEMRVRFDAQSIDPVYLDGPLAIPNEGFWIRLYEFLQLVSTAIAKTPGFYPAEMSLEQLLGTAKQNSFELDVVFTEGRRIEGFITGSPEPTEKLSNATSIGCLSIAFATFTYSAIVHFRSDHLLAETDGSVVVEFGPPEILEESIHLEYGAHEKALFAQKMERILDKEIKQGSLYIPLNELIPSPP